MNEKWQLAHQPLGVVESNYYQECPWNYEPSAQSVNQGLKQTVLSVGGNAMDLDRCYRDTTSGRCNIYLECAAQAYVVEPFTSLYRLNLATYLIKYSVFLWGNI
ncbi:hypothetical protein HII17_09815 [Thalassotalea sp. M1531]|uniref:Uncharacterized protein n=1 Tax=Thalassotalea algicola TaxID=2716224 RepID=A0A7Y0LDX2_9GAMM|nr:hypothetical protein [Thalassotalea algicola]NMP31861.1 hypothetical protein [Thalassotalea algicola]